MAYHNSHSKVWTWAFPFPIELKTSYKAFSGTPGPFLIAGVLRTVASRARPETGQKQLTCSWCGWASHLRWPVPWRALGRRPDWSNTAPRSPQTRMRFPRRVEAVMTSTKRRDDSRHVWNGWSIVSLGKSTITASLECYAHKRAHTHTHRQRNIYLLPSGAELQTAEAALGVVQADVLSRFSSETMSCGWLVVGASCFKTSSTMDRIAVWWTSFCLKLSLLLEVFAVSSNRTGLYWNGTIPDKNGHTLGPFLCPWNISWHPQIMVSCNEISENPKSFNWQTHTAKKPSLLLDKIPW